MVPNRRDYLKGCVGLGTIGLAGCLGGGDETSVTISTGGEGGTAFALVSALQSIVDDHSDSVSITNQTSPGYPSNFRLYDQGEIDAMAGDMVVLERAMNDEPPFEEEPVDDIAYQGFLMANFNLLFVKREGFEAETTGDLDGVNVWPTPTAFSTREVTEALLDRAGYLDDMNIIDADASDIVGAFQEGRVDVATVYGSNQIDLAGWVTELDSSIDLEHLPMDDHLIETAEDWPAVQYANIEPFGWQQDINADMIDTFALGTQLLFGSNVPEDVVYEIASISHENVDQAREAAASYPDHSDAANMTLPFIEELPVHPGAAQLYEEEDVWDSNWTEGELD